MKRYADWIVGGIGAVAVFAIPNALALLKAAGVW